MISLQNILKKVIILLFDLADTVFFITFVTVILLHYTNVPNVKFKKVSYFITLLRVVPILCHYFSLEYQPISADINPTSAGDTYFKSFHSVQQWTQTARLWTGFGPWVN